MWSDLIAPLLNTDSASWHILAEHFCDDNLIHIVCPDRYQITSLSNLLSLKVLVEDCTVHYERAPQDFYRNR